MKLTLKEKKEETIGTYSFIFEPDKPVDWKPGQFLRYHIEDPNPDERKNDRFFSIASAPFEKYIQLTTRFAQDKSSTFKNDLQNLSIGDVVEAQGPMGGFVLDNPEKDSYVFIAGGIGITPFRSMITEFAHNNVPFRITLLYANKTPEALFKNELERIAASHPSFKIHYAIDPIRIDEQFLREHISQIDQHIYYISGPEIMVQSMEELLKDLGVSAENVKRDYFPGYTWPLS